MWRSLYANLTNSINLSVDTMYLGWTNDLPAVVFCERPRNITSYVDFPQFIPPESDLTETSFFPFAKEFMYFEPGMSLTMDCFKKEKWLQTTPTDPNEVQEWQILKKACNTMRTNVTRFNNLRYTCTDIMRKCYWKNVEFNCCSHFQPMQTIYGRCYAINSMTTK